jgi:penicillin-insensitive murein endopeptidase
MNTLSYLFVLFVTVFLLSFSTSDAIEKYQKKHPNKGVSQTKGTVSKGLLMNAWLIPYSGKNFEYFSSKSYLLGRAFVHSKLHGTVVNAYQKLEKKLPNRKFRIMECSNQKGGKLHPHRTHQNGLSIDFMMPLKMNKKPYYELDDIGASHYWLDFNSKGEYKKNTAVKIDFEVLAQHILMLKEVGKKHGVRIKKVIINTDLKDELFATPSGKKLKNSGVYIVKSLTPLINGLHDDHYHIDFELI